MTSLALLAAGFTVLVLGANWFVSGACALAQRLGIPTIIVGLTIVAFGTSAPELAVSVSASVQGANDIALGNVIGSNLFNLLAVVGASALLAPLTVEKTLLRRDWRACIGATALLLLFANHNSEISRIDAACLLLCFTAILLLQISAAQKERHTAPPVPDERLPDKPLPDATLPTPPSMGAPRIALLICGGLASIIGAGQVSVAAASALARALGLSETLIGLTIVAIGTSLPELITSIVATKRGETAIAIGNVIGSNLFNILLILGVSCFIAPIAITAYVFADCILLFAASIVLFFLAKHGALSRRTGYALLLTYGAYLYWVVVR